MGTVGWLLVVAVGIALGFSVGRLWPGSAAKLTALQRERDAAREDLRLYRQEVSGHFERTAELFDKVTADYRGLYEHLAVSARRLGAIRGESADSRLAKPEQRRLTEIAPGVEQPAEPANPPQETGRSEPPLEPEEEAQDGAPDEAQDEAQDEAPAVATPVTDESPATPEQRPAPK